MTEPLVIAKSGVIDLSLLPAMANRHGLIAGATGTGKTITLQTLAEAFSQIGVPVFMADVKGDLSGISRAGGGNAKVEARVAELGIGALNYAAAPTVFWDVFGKKGHPLRSTVSEMGPLLLARMLNLNDVQAGVLTAAFKIADDNGWLLLDLKDLRALFNMRQRTLLSWQVNTAIFPRPALVLFNAACYNWNTKAAKTCSANRHWILMTCCKPRAAVE